MYIQTRIVVQVCLLILSSREELTIFFERRDPSVAFPDSPDEAPESLLL